MLKVDGPLRIGQAGLAVYSCSVFVLELFPVDDVSIERGYVKFWEFDSSTI